MVVLDASFAIYISGDARGEDDIATAASLVVEGLLAPPIFWHEVASALRSMRRQRVISAAASAAAMRSLRAFSIALEPSTPDIEPVVGVSEHYQLTIYDAAYLELAIRAGGRLATRDGGLAAAAARAGVATIRGS